MFFRRALQTPALRQIGRGLLRPRSVTPLQIQHRSIRFRWPRDGEPAYKYDPGKRSLARPVYTPRQGDYVSAGTVVVALGAGAAVFYYSHIEEVPITGRKRFNCYSPESTAEQGELQYRIIMDEERAHLLPAWDPRTKQVERVLNRLLPVSGMGDGNWEVHVLDKPDTRNAFVIPGNKVFVYSGILKICRNDAGVAAVLSHEIAHNVASHSAERMSQSLLLQCIAYAVAYVDPTQLIGPFLARFALDLGVARPASRQQESEADYIGLLMMAGACYDPEAAVEFWRRMEKAAEQEGSSIPQFMSTHPSNANRISRIQEWLPKAEVIQSETDCSSIAQYSKDFIRAWGA